MQKWEFGNSVCNFVYFYYAINTPSSGPCYRTPRIMEKMVKIKDYKEPIRQITVIELGHEEPTILLTNQLKVSAVQLITRYAQRMIIENGIAEAINFFHLDALSSMVGLKVDFDLQITLIAGSLYRLMSKTVGREYARSNSKHPPILLVIQLPITRDRILFLGWCLQWPFAIARNFCCKTG